MKHIIKTKVFLSNNKELCIKSNPIDIKFLNDCDDVNDDNYPLFEDFAENFSEEMCDNITLDNMFKSNDIESDLMNNSDIWEDVITFHNIIDIDQYEEKYILYLLQKANDLAVIEMNKLK